MDFIRIIYTCALTIALAAAVSCSTQKLNPDDYRPTKPIQASTIYPTGESFSSNFLVTAGHHSGQNIRFSLNPHPNEPNQGPIPTNWIMTFQGIRQSHLQRKSDGSVQITRVDEYDDGVYALYDPPLTMLPAILNTDNPHHSIHKVVIRSLGSNEIRDHGQCSHSVKLLGKQYITTPAGNFDAYLVQSTWNIKLKLASANVVAKSWLVQGRGIVKSSIEKNVLLLGILPVNYLENMEYAGHED